ncbi:MAG TPA: hypothetical protein VF031_07500 [Alphaproteobacteria bacterium]
MPTLVPAGNGSGREVSGAAAVLPARADPPSRHDSLRGQKLAGRVPGHGSATLRAGDGTACLPPEKGRTDRSGLGQAAALA